MLKITVPLSEAFDETTQRFVVSEGFELELEHSLFSLSKWEAREEKPFLGKEPLSNEEILRYIQDMSREPIPDEMMKFLTNENLETINTYINAKMTATWFTENGPRRPSREIITAELVYYWMVALQIDFQCQHWHLNRLLTLVRVCNEKNKPAQKTNRRSALQQRRELNNQRRQQAGTTG